MDISFNCPNCEQELEVDASGAGSTIECPSCSATITVPSPPAALVPPVAEEKPAEPAKVEKHFAVPVREVAPAENLIQKASRPLEVIAKEGDKTLKIKSFKRYTCVENGKDRFDEVVSAFLEKVGLPNIVSVNPITYGYHEAGNSATVADYGVLIVYKG